jgi:hypothetical protein
MGSDNGDLGSLSSIDVSIGESLRLFAPQFTAVATHCRVHRAVTPRDLGRDAHGKSAARRGCTLRSVLGRETKTVFGIRNVALEPMSVD